MSVKQIDVQEAQERAAHQTRQVPQYSGGKERAWCCCAGVMEAGRELGDEDKELKRARAGTQTRTATEAGHERE